MAGLKLVCIAVVCMVLASDTVDATITCGQVTGYLVPCIVYARSSGSSPPPAGCCNGIRGLNGAAKTTPDRQNACRCIKQTALSLGGINYGTVAKMPGMCGVSLPYKISPGTDCNGVK